jgi:pyridoxamine 5'-phosphate oxidase family protein
VPVSFRYNPQHDSIDIGRHGFAGRKKYRDALRNPRMAVVVDDLASIDPWPPRGIEMRGEAEVLPTGGKEIMTAFDDDMLRVRPRRIVSWRLRRELAETHAAAFRAPGTQRERLARSDRAVSRNVFRCPCRTAMGVGHTR